MTPTLMQDLLFEDVLFGADARMEHAAFREILGRVARISDIADLLRESFEQSEAREAFLEALFRVWEVAPVDREALCAVPGPELARRAIEGWYHHHGDEIGYHMVLPPLPNLFFSRDPASVIGGGISINNMATRVRRIEPVIVGTVARFHPRFALDEGRVLFDGPSILPAGPEDARFSLEGGDILVISEEVVVIGVSERTTLSSITMLAEHMRQRFVAGESRVRVVLAALMPARRAFMHLDTIFTQIDEEHCLVFPPLMDPASKEVLPVLRIDLSKEDLRIRHIESLVGALALEGCPLDPISCGGASRLEQEREQWTDGANAFCLAPGVIVIYERNQRTAEELARRGYHVLSPTDALEPSYDLVDGKRYAITMKGNELSRGRGGPRCMTMPILRDAIS